MIADDTFERSQPPTFYTTVAEHAIPVSIKFLHAVAKRQPHLLSNSDTPMHAIWFGMHTVYEVQLRCANCRLEHTHIAVLRNVFATWFLMKCTVCMHTRPWTLAS